MMTTTGKLFSELSEVQKKKVYDLFREQEWNSVDVSYFADSFEEILEENNYGELDEIQFSLNYCQGDGVAFYGSVEDENEILAIAERHLNEGDIDLLSGILQRAPLSIEVTRNHWGHHYSHCNTMDICVNVQDEELTEEEVFLLGKFESKVTAEIKYLSRGMERMGYDELEYLSSDERIAELCITNEYRFIEEISEVEDGVFYI